MGTLKTLQPALYKTVQILYTIPAIPLLPIAILSRTSPNGKVYLYQWGGTPPFWLVFVQVILTGWYYNKEGLTVCSCQTFFALSV
jgi:ABC-type nitrate/sulfonate/bicarbonate transport system permease component